MATTSKVLIDEGTGVALPTYDLSEDAVTKKLSRSVLNTSAGVEAGTSGSPLRVDPTGTTVQPMSAASLPLPTGASTASNQSTGNASLASIDGKITAVNTGAVTVASSALPTGAATATKQDTGNTSVASIDTKTPALGQALAAASVPVVLTAAQITTLTPPAQGLTDTQLRATAVPVSGTVTANIGTSGSLALDATLTGGTQKSIVRAAAKGATTAADVTSTAQSSDRQALDVQIRTSAGAAVDTFGGGTQYATGAATGTPTGTVSLGWDGSNVKALPLDASGFLKVNVAAGGASGGTSSSFGAAVPATGTAAGFSDGTNMQIPRAFDGDSGAGTQYVSGAILRKSASGGSVEAGTSSDPLRIDPTGTTTQPVSAASLPLPTGAATETTLGGVLTTSDFDSKTGTLTETAPATDTASSGLNGRLQRIAQRLTSLITALGSPFQAGGSIGNTSFASTVADGANVTIGAKADAKSTATDTTAVSTMSVLKEISYMEQNPASRAVTNAGTFAVQPQAATSGGWTPFHLISAASTNATVVKNAAGQIGSFNIGNTNAAIRFVKLYDKATTPSVGTDVPVKTLLIPGSTTGGGNAQNYPLGVLFSNGISIATTTGIADSDTAAVGLNDLCINIDYK